jgi:formylglycine-generating enzyme required for sulfatase activity
VAGVAVILGFGIGGASVAQAVVNIQYVPVGNPGNSPDQTYTSNGGAFAAGAVSYNYAIGATEVTNAQYTEFLNTVDPAGGNTLNLYDAQMSTDAQGGINFNSGAANGAKYQIKSGYANKPVVMVGFLDAMRFTNWLGNGQGAGSTETGAYTVSLGVLAPRNPGATVWIPSENEWYKAAYHQPAAQGGDVDNYWLYAMRTNAVPFSDQPPGATPDNTRVGNFYNEDALANGYNDGFAATGDTTVDPLLTYVTDVGAYTQSPSFYGTFDQGGNVYEWNETIFNGGREVRGSSYFWEEIVQRASFRDFSSSVSGDDNIGFRVATIPEPASLGLLSIATIGLIAPRRRRV